MNYERFAYIYDELMQDVPYHQWVKLINEKRAIYGIKGSKLLDLACGTGELSVRLAQEGYDVTGVDLSSDMLSIAQTKATANGVAIDLLQQNMTDLQLLDKYDVIGIFCDSLNYLNNPEEIKQTFKGVHKHLSDGGLFIFDVHSIYKMTDIFVDQTFTYDQGEICYIWNCFPGDWPNSVEHELTFFVETETGKYDRFDELHIQRTFPINDYKNWLKEAGFEVLEVTGDFLNREPAQETERIFFTVRKK